jgi:8-oxo-dGTP pyrophosphatase MutT (NUDIX family)
MNQIADIIKYAAVIINPENQYLIVRDSDQTHWKNVGGQPLEGETPEECLRREVQEELSVKVMGTPEYYFSCPITPTVSDPTRTVQIILYRVAIEGEPKPSSEIGEIHWLSKEEFFGKKFNLTPQIEELIVPRLVADGVIE